MKTLRTVPRERWAGALDALTGERRGAPVTLIVDWTSAGEEVEAHDVLLQGISYDRRGDVVEVVAQRPAPNGYTMLRHHVSAPESLEIDAAAGIVPSEVQVRGADGVVTIVRIGTAPTVAS